MPPSFVHAPFSAQSSASEARARSRTPDVGKRLKQQRDTSSVDTLYVEDEEELSRGRTGGVDVRDAEGRFEDLRRQLSRQSRTVKDVSDQEKAETSSTSEFDLLAYLEAEQESADLAGFKKKALGVCWEDLRVEGEGGEKAMMATFLDACTDWALYLPHMVMHLAGFSRPTPKDLLVDFNGCLKPGEMCLVLGRPGSGCSTFLKTIANNRGGYLSVSGNVHYGSIPASEMEKRYRGEVVYNQEDDVHSANLTVAQTLLFALKLKTPGRLLPGKTAKGLRVEVLDMLVNMLGISHTKDTKVGSAEVRGISGGERKRVSIAEMMATRATVCSWDNSSRGLDASSALDYAKSIRVLTDIHQSSTFVSLYQAGEGIFEQFDKVLLIDEGRTVFFGPAREARAYMMSLGFADLPRSTSADYLTGCTDPNERKFSPSVDPASVPATPQALATAFRNSPIHARMIAERDAYLAHVRADEKRTEDFREAVASDKRRGSRQKSPYTASFVSQVWALMGRHIQLKMQDRVDLFAQYASTLTIALIIGFAFLQLNTDSSGASSRPGGIFLAVIFLAFQAFNELPSQMTGRPIVWKHKTFALYRPAAVSLASILADLPNHLLLNLLFHLIVYWLMGLYPSAGAFFSYFAIATACYLAVSAMFRLTGSVCSNYNSANKYTVVMTTFFELLSGYLISIPDQRRYIFWLSYLNPMFYGFSGVMINEFKRIDITCDGDYIFPNSLGGALPQYPTVLGDAQTCLLAGAEGGSRIIPGLDYLYARYGFSRNEQWRNFGILLAMYIAVLAVQAVCAELLPDGSTVARVNVYAKENKERRRLNAELEKNKAAYRRGEMEQDLSALVATRQAFTWSDLTYTVPVSGGHRQLLDHVNGYVRPGELTALMGSSGAGKTTLLDVLANRKTTGVIGGQRLMGGRVPGREFQRGTAFAEQQDVHDPTATVREAFRFSAYLRQPASVSKEEKDRYVEEVLSLLELEDKADAKIGYPGYGLDVEARKRVTIGVELASKPQLLLFLDEPTSGLDAQSAANIVRFLRKLASAGQPILVTIHQPSDSLIANFDRLLLLKSGGRCVYFGDIGKDAYVLRDYFARHGAECPPTANPAEYMLEAIGAGSSKQVGKRDWADLWLESPELEVVKQTIAQLDSEGEKFAQADDASLQQEYATSVWAQTKIVTERSLKAFWRSPDYGFTRLYNHVSTAVILVAVYPNLGNSLTEALYRLYAIFYLVVLPALLMPQVQPMFAHNRETFHRESSSKMYSASVFGLSQIIAEMPYSILCSIIFFLLFYYPIGFNTSSERAGYAYAMILLLELFSVTCGQMVAALMPTSYVAEMMNPFLLIIFSAFAGVTIIPSALGRFWRSWLLQVNPFSWFVEGFMVNEMGGLKIECKPSELRNFTPPTGQTCLDWAGAFIARAGGYLVDPDATSGCQYCEAATGDEYIAKYGWLYEHRARNLGIFLCYVIFNILVTIAAARFLTHRYSKR